jgi:uncharacterized protein YbjQ (UPF0145 family)
MTACSRCGKELSFVTRRDYGGQPVCAACREALTAAPVASRPEPMPLPVVPATHTGPVALTTGQTVPGAEVAAVLDVVHAVVILGIDKRKESLAALQNLPGARAERLESEVRAACASANAELRSEAARIGGQAVLGARFEVTVDTPWGSTVNERVLIVTASGTAVRLVQAQ